MADADADGICATRMTASASSMLAASATDRARFTTADVLTSQKATATATATSLTPWASTGGDCAADANGNGVCDNSEVGGCTEVFCNYDDALPLRMTDLRLSVH